MARFSLPVLDSLASHIAVIDREGNIVAVNEPWLRFARDNGDPPAEKIGVGANYFDVCAQARGEGAHDAVLALQGLLSITRGEHDHFQLDYPCHSPWEKRWYRVRAARLKDDSGIVVAHTDVTERVLAEMYLDVMGHDVKNMAQVAMGYLEMAMEDLLREHGLGEAQASMLSASHDAVGGIARLIDDVRKVQREMLGEPGESLFDVYLVLAELAHHFRHTPGRDISIDLRGEKQCEVIANELIRDVFANILGNSIKHSSGPLQISISISKADVGHKQYCKVTIDDDGPGMPDAGKRRALECAPLARREAGVGLGLCLARLLVESFRGRLWIEDRVPGDYTQGLRSVVMLPVSA